MAEEGIFISERDWRKLLAAGSGDTALLYLFLRVGGNIANAETSLRMSSARMEDSVASLKQLGLWQEAPKVIRPAGPPSYSETDVIREMKSQSFQQLLGEVQRRIGKVLSTEDMKILLSLYDYLGLSPEVISILISFCIQRSKARQGRSGGSRPPSMRTIEREAYHWADLGIDTLEEASAYVQQQLEQHSTINRIRTDLQISGRKLTTAEENMVRQWLGWGFGEAEIVKAYEKTCMNTGGLKWPYLNSILSSWHQQGLHTLSEIEEKDKAPAKPGAGSDGTPSQLELDAIRRMMGTEVP